MSRPKRTQEELDKAAVQRCAAQHSFYARWIYSMHSKAPSLYKAVIVATQSIAARHYEAARCWPNWRRPD